MRELVDFSQPMLLFSAASIIFNPLYWNIVSRQEYHNKLLTRLAGGNPRLGCYVLAFSIFFLGIVRDCIYERALRTQPSLDQLQTDLVKSFAIVIFLSGNLLVLSSMWALGITGTYLGDYFGILMDHVVTGFPFNITRSPMYYGSTMSFLATALWLGKPAGILLTFEVFVAYKIALSYEDPFTSEIYAQKAHQRTKKQG